ncbi:MAG TPA: hypothetical protein DCR04_05080 [Flavobacteriales bacterium]|nr:hypothetical protein [Flavobacteriales bacterium]
MTSKTISITYSDRRQGDTLPFLLLQPPKTAIYLPNCPNRGKGRFFDKRGGLIRDARIEKSD